MMQAVLEWVVASKWCLKMLQQPDNLRILKATTIKKTTLRKISLRIT